MNASLIYCGEPERPPMPQTSFQQQYQRLDATDDARPLSAAYSDIAEHEGQSGLAIQVRPGRCGTLTLGR